MHSCCCVHPSMWTLTPPLRWLWCLALPRPVVSRPIPGDCFSARPLSAHSLPAAHPLRGHVQRPGSHRCSAAHCAVQRRWHNGGSCGTSCLPLEHLMLRLDGQRLALRFTPPIPPPVVADYSCGRRCVRKSCRPVYDHRHRWRIGYRGWCGDRPTLHPVVNHGGSRTSALVTLDALASAAAGSHASL